MRRILSLLVAVLALMVFVAGCDSSDPFEWLRTDTNAGRTVWRMGIGRNFAARVIITDVTPRGMYHAKIAAVVDAPDVYEPIGEPPPWNPGTNLPSNPDAPEVTDLIVRVGGTAEAPTLALNWRPSAGAVRYVVQWSTDGNTWQTAAEPTVNSATVAVAPGQVSARVAAVGKLQGPWQTWTGTTDIQPPLMPAPVLAQPYEAAQTKAAAAEQAVNDLQSTLDIPTPAPADAGRGLVADGGSGWILGGTAAALNAGDAPENVATNGRVADVISAQVTMVLSPQTIIKAQCGARPDGWVESDCDAPVASMAFSGSSLTVKSGLQVAYADRGRVLPSTELVSPIEEDMVAKGDGVYYVYVDISDEEISSVGTTSIAPSVGSGRSSVTVQDALTIVSSVNATDSPYAIDGNTNTAATIPDNLTGYIVFEKNHIGPCTLKMLSNDTYTNTFRVSVSSDGVSFTTLPTIYSLLKNTWTEYAIQTSCRFIKLEGYGNPGGAFCVIRELQSYTPVQAGGDFYDVAAVTMRDGNDMPIRRVYLGTVSKSGGVITGVNCYAIGVSVVIPANNGANITTNTVIVSANPYLYHTTVRADAQIFAEGKWGRTGWIYSSSNNQSFGVIASSLIEGLRMRSGSAISLASAAGGGDFTTAIAPPARCRIIVNRGY
jgi:hypothetical protein